jgi:segregation and condensation protein B
MQKEIEAILFYKNEPVSLRELAKLLELPESQIKTSLDGLRASLEGRGLVLVENDSEYSLATSPETSSLVEKVAKDELGKEIGKAGLETLSIILYKGSASRREIDYIRGVNSNFILRSLLMRGLVRREENDKDGRVYSYKPTMELLSYLGIDTIHKLPEYERVKQSLESVQTNAE